MSRNDRSRNFRFVPAALALAVAAALPAHAGVTDTELMQGSAYTSGVLSAGIGSQGQRFSPLAKVNTGNVSRLVPAWSFSFGGEKQRGQESQPVVYNGKMFVTGS